MARPPKGKPLTLRPIRLDDDVWAECQGLGKEYGTINEGMAAAHAALRMQRAQGRMIPLSQPQPLVTLDAVAPELASGRGKVSTETWKRGPRPKGDRNR